MVIYLAMMENEADQSKFTQIYKLYHKTMFYTAQRILGDGKDTEDIVHDAFIKIIEILYQIEEIECPKTRNLIVTIVERKAIDLYRRRKNKPMLSLDALLINVPSADEIAAIPGKSDLSKALALLPTVSRQLLLLRYYHGYSEKEIAELLSMSYDAVRKGMQRARERLEKTMREHGWEAPYL